MKNLKSALIFSVLALSFAQSAVAAPKKTASSTPSAPAKKINVEADVDSLGGNEELMKMAQSLRPETRSRIVQDRIVDRRNKFEFGLSYGGVLGGDAYLRTQAVGLRADFHFTPRWSLGAHYYDYTNNLTPEGERVFNQARQSYAAGNRAFAVDIDSPLNSTMAVINWYPIYGKTSFLDLGVTQFDLYLLAGAGQITLSSGSTPTYSAGLGVGAWVSRHVAIRTEIKYQNYTDQLITGSRKLNTVTASVGLGWIL